MNLKKLTQGFTLVEMLVVIAIIAILAAALFPAISTAMDMARATALKSKSKGIWNAILVANNEREPLGKSPLWPEDVAKNSTSTEYFQYLLSDGDGTPTDVQDDRLVSDLSFDTFSAPGVVTAVSASEFNKDHIAWRAGRVGSKSPLDLPFLVTRNIEGDSFSCSGPDDEGKVKLNGENPFGEKRAVWISVGGSTKDARKRYFDNTTFFNGYTTNGFAIIKL